MFQMVQFGARIDNWSREPGFPLAMGDPHPDALLVDAAVQRLTRFADQALDDDLGLIPELSEFGVDEKAAMRKALEAVVTIVTQNAKLGRRPFWSSKTSFRGVRFSNGAPMVMCWKTYTAQTIAETEVQHEALVPVGLLKSGDYPVGSHCPLKYEPEPKLIAQERAEYAVWWAALNALATELAGTLSSVSVLEPAAAQRPWSENRDLGKPARVFDDVSARVYRQQQRQTAAAYRALGHRRPVGVRGATNIRMAPKRVALPAAATG